MKSSLINNTPNTPTVYFSCPFCDMAVTVVKHMEECIGGKMEIFKCSRCGCVLAAEIIDDVEDIDDSQEE